MADLGLNVPWLGTLAEPSRIANTGTRWQRLVVTPELDLTDYLQQCRETGLKTLLVVGTNSLPGLVGDRDPVSGVIPITDFDGVAARLKEYGARYGHLADAWELGNEPDLVSPFSWTMTPADLSQFLAVGRRAMPQATLISGGLANGGNPDFFNTVDLSSVNGLGIHPYTLRPDPNFPPDPTHLPHFVGNLLQTYRRFHKRFWVTEIGISSLEETDPEFQRQYCRRMLKRLLDTPDVETVFWFCLNDAMHDGFGLLDGDTEKPFLAEFRRFRRPLPPPVDGLRPPSRRGRAPSRRSRPAPERPER